MTHLDDSLLNEYLDGALDPPARQAVEAHLAVCAQCRRQCAVLNRVFGLLAALPEEPLAADLRPVQPLTLPRWLAPLALLQGLAAAALLAAAWPGALDGLDRGWRNLAVWGSAWAGAQHLGLAQTWAALIAAAQHAEVTLGAWPLQLGPSPQWPLSSLALLGGSALAAWAAGLRVILKTDHARLPQGGPHGTDR